jgi:hypothetical protein
MRAVTWLCAVFAATSVLALPAAAGGQTPAEDSVSGSGVAEFWGSFEIDVRSGPSGQNPSGQASFQAIVGPLSGPASCLSVTDNVATFNIPGTSFGLITFRATDNAGLGVPDLIEGIPTGRVPSDCSPLTSSVVSGSVLTGDVVVVDAPPFPTSKDECKNGGWRNFPGFKNQGDCVSFVATGGRNQPGT